MKFKHPDPGEPKIGMTDRFGDRIEVSPAGKGHVLFSIIPGDPEKESSHVEIPSHWILPLFTASVEATGLNTYQLKQLALMDNMVRQKPNRKQRRSK